jgi:hypothetical protein
LKNSNKQQQTRERGSEMVQSAKLLPGMGPSKVVAKWKGLPAFFESKEQAEKFIFETKRSGSVELAELAVEEKHILGVIRQSQKYEPRLLLEAWQRFEKEEIGDDRNLTVQELAEKFLARQKAQGRSTRTLIDDRSRLNAMTKVIGNIRAGAVKRADILRYMEGIAPGTNRRSHYKTLKKLWRWAYDLDYLLNDPMAKLKPLDEWGVNNEVLTPELFQRFLRVVQGVEAPREGLEATQQYKGLLAYFVLGGLQGLRTCEMVRKRAKDPVIQWRDFPLEEATDCCPRRSREANAGA